MSKKPANPELDAHLAERLPLLAQEARAARANGNKRVEEQKSQTINIALGRWAQRDHWAFHHRTCEGEHAWTSPRGSSGSRLPRDSKRPGPPHGPGLHSVRAIL